MRVFYICVVQYDGYEPHMVLSTQCVASGTEEMYFKFIALALIGWGLLYWTAQL